MLSFLWVRLLCKLPCVHEYEYVNLLRCPPSSFAYFPSLTSGIEKSMCKYGFGHYSTLKVRETATSGEIRSAYRKLSSFTILINKVLMQVNGGLIAPTTSFFALPKQTKCCPILRSVQRMISRSAQLGLQKITISASNPHSRGIIQRYLGARGSLY